jgi:dihydroorotate dehydrogenase (NAD+) catalytic subunit
MIDLSINLGKLRIKNPVIIASGTLGGIQHEITDLSKAGGIVLKTVTLKPLKGNPPPRIFETPSGIVNSIGLENPGIEAFLKNELPKYKKFDTAIIVSIAGKSILEYVRLTKILNRQKKLDGIELNISCPNIAHGLDFAQSPQLAYKITNAVKNVAKMPVFVKLSPNVNDIVPIAKASQDAGADGICLINTIKAMGVNWQTGRPTLGGVVGGLSGPAIKPVALRFVWEVASNVKIPVIGIGGISKAEDILEFMVAGATAIQIGTANLIDPKILLKITNDLKKLLYENGIWSIKKIIGTIKTKYLYGRPTPL